MKKDGLKINNNKMSRVQKKDSQNASSEKENSKTLSSSKEKEYEEKISQLEKELQKEREKSQSKQNDPNILANLKKEIDEKNQEIKNYVTINTKQRDQLETLSHEIDYKLNKMNYKAVTRSLQNERKKINENKFKKQCTEQEILDNNISSKEKQLKNIMQLIEILQKENGNLKSKLENAKNTEQKYKLIDGQKEQEKQLSNLQNDIKKKQFILKEHSKCTLIKTELLKKIASLKEDLSQQREKLSEVQKKLENIDIKLKMEQSKQKPNSSGGSANAGTAKTKTKIKLKNKSQKYEVPKQKPANILSEDDMVTVPPKVSEIFTEKELKAMLVALDKNKLKYETLLKRFNVQNTYVDSLETKHKLDIKQKLNKINELDEQIEFMNVKKGEYNANIQLFKKQIEEAQEEKKIYNMKINKITNEINQRNQINMRKDKEIKMLGAQLVKFKKYLKAGNLNKIKNEPEIQIQSDEITESSNLIEDGEVTAKTEFYENNDNDLNEVAIKKKNISVHNSDSGSGSNTDNDNDNDDNNNIIEKDAANNQNNSESNSVDNGENSGDNNNNDNDDKGMEFSSSQADS